MIASPVSGKTIQTQEIMSTPVMIAFSSIIVVSVGAFIVKWMFNQLAAHNEKRLLQLESSMNELAKGQTEIRLNYVSREELIRVVGDFDKRIETLGDRSDRQFDRIFSKLEAIAVSNKPHN